MHRHENDARCGADMAVGDVGLWEMLVCGLWCCVCGMLGVDLCGEWWVIPCGDCPSRNPRLQVGLSLRGRGVADFG